VSDSDAALVRKLHAAARRYKTAEDRRVIARNALHSAIRQARAGDQTMTYARIAKEVSTAYKMSLQRVAKIVEEDPNG
jgi:hypothetical protein